MTTELSESGPPPKTTQGYDAATLVRRIQDDDPRAEEELASRYSLGLEAPRRGCGSRSRRDENETDEKNW